MLSLIVLFAAARSGALRSSAMGSVPSVDQSCVRGRDGCTTCTTCATPGAEKLAMRLQDKIKKKAAKIQRQKRREELAAFRREEMAQGRLRL